MQNFDKFIMLVTLLFCLKMGYVIATTCRCPIPATVHVPYCHRPSSLPMVAINVRVPPLPF